MAKRLGVIQMTWISWEKGHHYPPPTKSEQIRKLLVTDTKFLSDDFFEFKEQVWTAKEVSKILGINHHTFSDWTNKSNRIKPRRNLSGTRQIYTESDIAQIKKELGERITATSNGTNRLNRIMRN